MQMRLLAVTRGGEGVLREAVEALEPAENVHHANVAFDAFQRDGDGVRALRLDTDDRGDVALDTLPDVDSAVLVGPLSLVCLQARSR